MDMDVVPDQVTDLDMKNLMMEVLAQFITWL